MTNQMGRPNERNWTHRADNRERLVAAGYQVLSEKGYEATTVKEVARVAGVSPGLFHYYFSSKDELLTAVLKEAGTRYGQMMKDLRQTIPAEHFLESSITAARERVKQEPQWYRLRYELFALGLRNPTFLPVLGELLSYIRQTLTQSLQEITGAEEAPSQAFASVVLACFDGLALQQLAQPDADLTGAYDLLLEVVRTLKPRVP